MSEMRILDETGDSNVEWDINNKDSIKKAKKQFDDLIKKGYTAFVVNNDGSQGKKVDEFNFEYEKVIMTPTMRKG